MVILGLPSNLSTSSVVAVYMLGCFAGQKQVELGGHAQLLKMVGQAQRSVRRVVEHGAVVGKCAVGGARRSGGSVRSVWSTARRVVPGEGAAFTTGIQSPFSVK
ncbi:Uncharacterized protein Fot_25806 [Forsythia ovata]|uniref:Uncharacterized protein n=1 Tax=Forsythia ovata TaxID=205694 RepID=A0ABD1UB79_9LAMI